MIDYEVRIEAPATVVFDMLTRADLLTEWMAAEARVDLRPGGEFHWIYPNGDVVLGRFIEIDHPRRLVLAYGWESPASRAIPPSSTEVEITLDEVDGATLLRLVHRGLPASEIEPHRGGWEYFMGRLRSAIGQEQRA
jgi:uncharacterized protein YndB with AHSA1/START domain